MPAFDRNFTPPAPVADVVVAHPVSSVTSGALRGKLDTGADLTVIPESLVPQLALRRGRMFWRAGMTAPSRKGRFTMSGSVWKATNCRRSVALRPIAATCSWDATSSIGSS